MTPETVLNIGRQAMETTLMLSAPLLLAALLVGLLVSIFQAATQINESTLAFIPKLLAVFATMLIAGPWMVNLMVDYMRQLFTALPTLAG